MIELTIETEIARPVTEVFAYVTDPDLLPTWQTNTVSAVKQDDGPLRVGSRLREIHRAPGGRELASLVEVAELEPERTFALRMLDGPLPIHARIAFAPTDRGTRMRFTVHGQPTGPMRLAQPLLRLALKRQFAGHGAALKRLLETP